MATRRSKQKKERSSSSSREQGDGPLSLSSTESMRGGDTQAVGRSHETTASASDSRIISGSDISRGSPSPMPAFLDAHESYNPNLLVSAPRVDPRGAYAFPEAIYNHFKGESKDRFQRLASKPKTRVARDVAKGAVTVGNWFTDHPWAPFLVWGILWVSHVFAKWGLEQSKAEGGNGNALSVLAHEVIDAFATLVLGAAALIFVIVVWKKIRGDKTFDPKAFEGAVDKLEEAFSDGVREDLWLKKAINNPKKPFDTLTEEEKRIAKDEWIEEHRFQRRHLAEESRSFDSWLDSGHENIEKYFESWYRSAAEAECRQCVSFHQGMIEFFMGRSLLEEARYWVKGVYDKFPFNFDAVRAPVSGLLLLGEQPEPLERRQETHRSGKEEEIVDDDAVLRRVVKDEEALYNASQEWGQATYLKSSFTVLGRVIRDGEQKQLRVGSHSSYASSTQGEADFQQYPGTEASSELYNRPLTSGFYSATKNERHKARGLDWRKDLVDRAEKPISRHDIGLRIVAFFRKREKDSAKGSKQVDINNVKNSLNIFLSKNPSDCDPTELRSRCLYILTYLRQATTYGQWESWEQFLMHDDIVTGAFKRLPVQKRAWMIRILLSGNDAGKLLALSILEDPRIPVTRFDHVKDRSRKTAVKDTLSDSSLTRFFEEFVRTYGTTEDPDERAEFCRQLYILTNNDEGRIGELLCSKGNRLIGAQILRSFTTALDDNYLLHQTEVGATNQIKPAYEVLPAHAQRLAWYGDVAALADEMDYGNPHNGTKGHPGSSAALYSIETSANRAIIKDRIFELKSMEGLRSLLLSRILPKREQGYRILAMLLDDLGSMGMEYQEIFRAFVDEHYDEVSTERHIDEFLEYCDEKNVKPTVKYRYVTALVCAERSRTNKIAETRANKIWTILSKAFPGLNLLDIFHEMHFCFYPSESKNNAFQESLKKHNQHADTLSAELRSNDKKLATLRAACKNAHREREVAWRERRKIFNLLFRYRAQRFSHQDDFLHRVLMRDDGEQSAFIDHILRLMSDNIDDSLDQIRSITDLLSSVIEMTYAEHMKLVQETEKPEQEQNREEIQRLQNRDLLWQIRNAIESSSDENVRLNLTVAAVSGLAHTKCKEAYADIWRVLKSFQSASGIGEGEDFSEENFNLFNEHFKKLGIFRYGNNKNGSILTLEWLYVEISYYFLCQAKAIHEAPAEANEREYPASTARACGRAGIACVVRQPALANNIKLYHKRIAELLPLLVNPFGELGMRYGKGKDHQCLVHKTLALFFQIENDVDVRPYATQFRTMLKLIGEAARHGESNLPQDRSDVVVGLQILLQALRDDTVIVFTEETISCLQALALYSELQTSSRPVINDLQEMLGGAELDESSSLWHAFGALGMESDREKLCNIFRRQTSSVWNRLWKERNLDEGEGAYLLSDFRGDAGPAHEEFVLN